MQCGRRPPGIVEEQARGRQRTFAGSKLAIRGPLFPVLLRLALNIALLTEGVRCGIDGLRRMLYLNLPEEVQVCAVAISCR